MTELLKTFLAVLGGVGLTVATITAAAYGLFRFLGEKWLSAKFEERLAAYKHEQQKELERLKLEINTLMDRTVKLHQREFDVLPEAWGRANDAFAAVQPMGLGVNQYPDVDRMSRSEMESLLESSELESWQKDELRNSSSKTEYYRKAIIPIKAVKAHNTLAEFSIFFAKNGIFIPEPLKSRFEAINDMMFAAMLERRFSIQYPDTPPQFEKGMILHEKGRQLLRSLEAEVQARLWNQDAGRIR